MQVGTPDILQDRKFLKIMYKDFSVQKTDFFQNILYGINFIRKREEHALVEYTALHYTELNYTTLHCIQIGEVHCHN